MKLLRILALGIMFSLTCANTTLPSTKFKLADFTATSTLPKSDTWIIIDNSGTTDDFIGLKIILKLAEKENRKIKLVFPNIVTIPDNAFYTTDEPPIISLVSVSASKATNIGYYAFGYCYSLAEVNIPLATTIGNAAFWDCTALAEINIPLATTIEISAFYDCDGLTKIFLPLATNIGSYAFLLCDALTEVHIPLATTIGYGAFSGCPALTTMTIATESTLKNIDPNAFSNSYGSTSTDTAKITVTTRAGANVKKITDLNVDFKEILSIGGNTLLPSTKFNLTDFTATSTLPTDDTWIIIDSGDPLESEFEGLKTALRHAEKENRKIKLVFPNIVTIPRYAFCTIYPNERFKSLVSVSASKATSIGEYAFYNCSYLAEISFPLVTDIGERAFNDCQTLTKISFPLVTDIGEAAFAGCYSLIKVSLPLATTIGGSAFIDCPSLTEISIPLATDIGVGAFYGCYSLTKISIPLATDIKESTFSDCSSLTEVSIPLATYIRDGAFSGCTALTEVSFPLATYIGEWAFSGCTALTTITIATKSTLENIDSNAFARYSESDEYSDGSTDTDTDTTKITITTRAGANVKKITDLNVDFKEIIGQ